MLKLAFQGMLEDIDTKENSPSLLQRHGTIRFANFIDRKLLRKS